MAAEPGATTPQNPVQNTRARLPLPLPAHRRCDPRVERPTRARRKVAAMSGRDWQAFDAELRARAPEIAEDLLGKPVVRAGQEWRWGRKGSLAVVIAEASGPILRQRRKNCRRCGWPGPMMPTPKA